jgi:hypothetical protein
MVYRVPFCRNSRVTVLMQLTPLSGVYAALSYFRPVRKLTRPFRSDRVFPTRNRPALEMFALRAGILLPFRLLANVPMLALKAA